MRETTTSWYYLDGIDVVGSDANDSGAVVAFGDSITDGAASTVDADQRYPDILAERLDQKLREWSPETAEQDRSRVVEIIELAD